MSQDTQVQPQEIIKNDEMKEAGVSISNKGEQLLQPQEQKSPQVSEKEEILSRKERELWKREKQFEEKAKQYEEKLKSFEAWESEKQSLKSNPDLLLQKFDLTFEDLVNSKLGVGSEPKAKTADDVYKEVMEKFEKEKMEMQKEREKEREDREKKELELYKKQISEHIEKNIDKYETIKFLGDSDSVYNLIKSHYDETGELLTFDKAAEKVEGKLESLVKGVLALKKYMPKIEKKEEMLAEKKDLPIQPKNTQEPDFNATLQEMIRRGTAFADKKYATLSNNLHSQPSPGEKSLSFEEAKRKAAELFFKQS